MHLLLSHPPPQEPYHDDPFSASLKHDTNTPQYQTQPPYYDDPSHSSPPPTYRDGSSPHPYPHYSHGSISSLLHLASEVDSTTNADAPPSYHVAIAVAYDGAVDPRIQSTYYPPGHALQNDDEDCLDEADYMAYRVERWVARVVVLGVVGMLGLPMAIMAWKGGML